MGAFFLDTAQCVQPWWPSGQVFVGPRGLASFFLVVPVDVASEELGQDPGRWLHRRMEE